MERAKEIARRVLSDGYDPLLACRDLARLRPRLPGVADDIMNTFIGVASEVDDLPIGPERKHWAADALKAKDVEAANYRERIRAVVEKSLRGLLASLGGMP
ncbi:MAG: hypothetical protein H7A12_08400 [Pseudomonadales bacterium]|nr:hypothetical protein [Pseudomonadales bacterium]MCP5337629.1 hypothetical protein [Pseudomonadales bacterium]